MELGGSKAGQEEEIFSRTIGRNEHEGTPDREGHPWCLKGIPIGLEGRCSPRRRGRKC